MNIALHHTDHPSNSRLFAYSFPITTQSNSMRGRPFLGGDHMMMRRPWSDIDLCLHEFCEQPFDATEKQ